MDPILPFLRHRTDGRSVEEVLEDLQGEATHDPERLRQLMAVRYYIHFTISGVQAQWLEITRRLTNHQTLFDELRRLVPKEQRISLVTLNYDTLVEDALRRRQSVEFHDLHSYVSGDRWNLYKLHGSMNWARKVKLPSVDWGERNAWQVAEKLIARAPDIEPTADIVLSDQRPISMTDDGPYVPAVALPLRSKQDFECPPEHVRQLRAALPNVTQMLVIGWRATDEPFLELLGNAKPPVDRFHYVGRDNVDEPIARLRKVVPGGDLTAFTGGFTEYVLSRRVRELFAQSPLS